jgi:hypothetical protein
MPRWDVIPVGQQKPGRLIGGVWVVIQAYTVANHWTVAMLGPEGARVTGGYGGWNVVPVPRSIGITEWDGEPNMEMEIDLLYDGWLSHVNFPWLPQSFRTLPKLSTGVTFQAANTGKPVGWTAGRSSLPGRVQPYSSGLGWLPGTRSAVVSRSGAPIARRIPAPQPRRPPPFRRPPKTRLRGVWLESMLEELESLALKQAGDENPHSVRLYGAVPHTDRRWVIQGLDWGEAIRDQQTGRRMRQQVTVHLMQFYQPAAIRNLPRGKAA